MKYIEFPNASITATNEWASTEIWKNQTNNYALVMGWEPVFLYLPSSVAPYWQLMMNIAILNPNNKTIGAVVEETIEVFNASGSTTVYNGTSMVSEPTVQPTVFHSFQSNIGKAIVPPQCSLSLAIYPTGQQTVSTKGGWGFLLDDDELKNFVINQLQRDKNAWVIKL
ncbi:MAG: hypothetical protein QXP36_05345 [Conexivisphaerales archaeon]